MKENVDVATYMAMKRMSIDLLRLPCARIESTLQAKRNKPANRHQHTAIFCMYYNNMPKSHEGIHI